MRKAMIATLGAILVLAPTAGAAVIRPDTFADEPGGAPDNGNCTLREAVMSANRDVSEDACRRGNGADVIRLRRGVYQLSVPGGDPSPGQSEVDDRSGDLDLADPVTVVGPKLRATVDTGGHDRAFQFIFGTSTLKRLLIRNGNAVGPGGGVNVLDCCGGAHARIIDSTIRDSRSIGGSGGGASAAGPGAKLTFRDSRVLGNRVHQEFADGGGINVGAGARLRLDHSTVAGNSLITSFHQSGGAISFTGATAAITDSTISGNQARGDGGGIFSCGGMTVARSKVVANHSFEYGGGLQLCQGGTTVITDSEIAGNRADRDGGGLRAGSGGEVRTLELVIRGSTISGNTANDGGGLFLAHGAQGSVQRILSSTVTDNQARNGGGITGLFVEGKRPVLKGTILAGNVATRTDIPTPGPDCRSRVASAGHNLFGDLSACVLAKRGSDIVRRKPRLQALGENGGPTRTHALRPRSPARNAGPPNAPAKDQRGAPRRRPDIGAYELVRCAGATVKVVGTPRRDVLRGTSGRDGILGLGGADVLRARGGNDVVCGGRGRDKLVGGRGRDLCHGGAGRDRAHRSCERVRKVP